MPWASNVVSRANVGEHRTPRSKSQVHNWATGQFSQSFSANNVENEVHIKFDCLVEILNGCDGRVQLSGCSQQQVPSVSVQSSKFHCYKVTLAESQSGSSSEHFSNQRTCCRSDHFPGSSAAKCSANDCSLPSDTGYFLVVQCSIFQPLVHWGLGGRCLICEQLVLIKHYMTLFPIVRSDIRCVCLWRSARAECPGSSGGEAHQRAAAPEQGEASSHTLV